MKDKPITGWRRTTVPKHSSPRRTTLRADMVATGSFRQVIPPWLPKSRGGIPGRCSDLNSHAGERRWARFRQDGTARFRREINGMTQTPNKKRAHGAATPWTQTETIDNLKEGQLFCNSTTVAFSVSRVNKRSIKEERPNKMVPNPKPPVSRALFAQAVFIAVVALAVVFAFLRKPQSEISTTAPAFNGERACHHQHQCRRQHRDRCRLSRARLQTSAHVNCPGLRWRTTKTDCGTSPGSCLGSRR